MRGGALCGFTANNAGGITDDPGPNLGTDFDMWYLIQAGISTNSPVILPDYRASGTTSTGDLVLGNYPAPTNWDEFLLTSGPASDGGVAISWGDVKVSNTLFGEGWTIANGQNNTFIARPRNYRPGAIPAGDISATYRIANWGSVGGDPGMVDFATGVWDYVPGNSETVPVISSADIAPLPAGTNPPTTNRETRRFNVEASKLSDHIVIYTVSTDFPMAQKRWCGAAGVDKVKVVSDVVDAEFGIKYGTLIKDRRYLRQRSDFIVGRDGKLTYVKYLPTLGQEPDYDEVIAEAKKALG